MSQWIRSKNACSVAKSEMLSVNSASYAKRVLNPLFLRSKNTYPLKSPLKAKLNIDIYSQMQIYGEVSQS